MSKPDPKQRLIHSLRAQVARCVDKEQLSSAIFFADKAMTLSNDVSDVHMLAKLYHTTKQFRRAIHLLKHSGSIERDFRCRYLAALCYAECHEWEECLELIGKESTVAETTELSSTTCLLRGRAFEALEQRTLAARWYKEAVRRDIYCYEALEHLAEKQMLTSEEETEFIASLQSTSTEDTRWLVELYCSKLGKYAVTHKVAQALASLESAGLEGNVDVLTSRAELLFARHDYVKAHKVTTRLLSLDPHIRRNSPALLVHIACLVEFGKKNDLFYLSHQLMAEDATGNSGAAVSSGNTPLAWYAAGSYYFLLRKYETARKFYAKATSLDVNFGAAWLAYGHAFAASGEHDQAMAAYRIAARTLAGSPMPPVCLGMELLKLNNLGLAQQFLTTALAVDPHDPLPHHELGVVAYRNGDLAAAVAAFAKALSLARAGTGFEQSPTDSAAGLSEAWEPTVFNLGHAYRKMGDYGAAVRHYELALSLAPHNAATHSALGFTHHLAGRVDKAIECYHQALGLRPEDTFATEMLAKALSDTWEA